MIVLEKELERNPEDQETAKKFALAEDLYYSYKDNVAKERVEEEKKLEEEELYGPPDEDF